MKIKRIIGLILAVAMTFAFVTSCGEKPSSESESGSDIVKTTAPQNVKVDNSGLVTWDAIANVNVYIVEVDGGSGEWVNEPDYQLKDIEKEHTIVVSANVRGADGSSYTTDKSAEVRFVPYKEPFDVSKVKIAITSSTTTIKSGASAQNASAVFTATVTGGEKGFDTGVDWQIIEGKEYAKEFSAEGNKFTVVAADNVDGDKDIVVVATSKAYPTISAKKSVAVVSKPELTQEMLDKAGSAHKIGFEGYIQLDVYEYDFSAADQKGKLAATQTSTVKTAMSDENDEDIKKRNSWFAEYMNASVGVHQQLYCRKDDSGNACEVGVSLMNEEKLYPMKNTDGSYTTWEQSGLYNNFKGLSVGDFELNEDTWRFEYKASEKGTEKAQRMVASANPYEFDPITFDLIIDGNEIIGISAVAKDSYSIVEGYITVQTLRAVFNTDDNVTVQTIGKFKTLDEYKKLGETNDEDKEWYEELSVLGDAISNMKSLTSYETKFTNMQLTNLGASSTFTEGYDEVVVENYRYFNPCSITTVNGEQVRNYKANSTYGFKRVKDKDGTYRDDIYNAFYEQDPEEGISGTVYAPTRAYTDGFDSSKASFEFSPEIFTSRAISDDKKTRYFYADETMCSVATTLFKDLGNNTALYGIFATVVQDTSGTRITPILTVEEVDGNWYITGVLFYYDMGVTTGIVEIEYSNFNTAKLADDIAEAIDGAKVRELPASWHEVNITIAANGSRKEQNVPVDEFLFKGYTDSLGDDHKAYFGDINLPINDGVEIPFFGDKACFGDAYALGMATYFWTTDPVTYVKKQQNAICFYYDVPLDNDYTITTSLDAVRAFLTANGFEIAYSDVFRKGNLCVRPVDSSLDLFVYVWTEEQLKKPENVRIEGDKILWDAVENATGYTVYVDGVEAAKGIKKTEHIIGYSHKDGKDHIITVVATSDKYMSSPKSDELVYNSSK